MAIRRKSVNDLNGLAMDPARPRQAAKVRDKAAQVTSLSGSL
jgi:hypothetical protein